MDERRPVERHESFADKEVDINIKINPRKILRYSIYVVVLLFVFSIGRFTADTGGGAEIAVADSGSFSLTGWFAGIGGDDNEEETEVEEVPPEEVVEEEPPAEEEIVEEDPIDEETPVEEEVVEEEVADEDEIIITSYGGVAVSINRVDKEWKGTWGKITKLSFTIKNSEVGTIKPDHLMMTVEGYKEASEQRKIPLSVEARNIKAGQSYSGEAAVPSSSGGSAGGFNYHPSTTGRLENVRISVILMDDTSKPMASFTKEFNLAE